MQSQCSDEYNQKKKESFCVFLLLPKSLVGMLLVSLGFAVITLLPASMGVLEKDLNNFSKFLRVQRSLLKSFHCM